MPELQPACADALTSAAIALNRAGTLEIPGKVLLVS